MHSIEQHRLRKLIGFRTECHANSGPGVLETEHTGRRGNFQGASYCALKFPKGLSKLSYERGCQEKNLPRPPCGGNLFGSHPAR
jgi:hypothetical protein